MTSPGGPVIQKRSAKGRGAIKVLILLLAVAATVAFWLWRRAHPVVGLRATVESLGVGVAWVAVLVSSGIWKGKPSSFEVPVTYFNSAWNPDAVDRAGLFLGWLVDERLLSPEWSEDGNVRSFSRREITGPQLLEDWGEKIISAMLDDVGNAFTLDYFAASDTYWDDYKEVLGDSRESSDSDTWEDFAVLKERIDMRFGAWKSQFHPE